MRIVYFSLGWVMVALGVIGLIMPLMPGAVFLIIAAWCFARSSPRFEAWLLNHPTFGKPLRDWRGSGAIPRSAKVMACAGMAIGFAVFWYSVAPVAAAGGCAWRRDFWPVPPTSYRARRSPISALRSAGIPRTTTNAKPLPALKRHDASLADRPGTCFATKGNL